VRLNVQIGGASRQSPRPPLASPQRLTNRRAACGCGPAFHPHRRIEDAPSPSHTCGALPRPTSDGARLSGWATHGPVAVLFIDLRDHYGNHQVVAILTAGVKAAAMLRSEW